MSLPDLLFPTYRNMLKSLAAWLEKAQAQTPGEAEALVSARLAPDMFPLATQVRFACVQALEAVHRLRGEEFPDTLAVMRDEGVNAGERPGSMADSLARIAETLAVLDGADPAAFDVDPQSLIAHAIPNGMIFDLTAEQYARDWALPQFYFHLMTAYAILRNQGVELGKADYAAPMFGYLRPGTMPRP